MNQYKYKSLFLALFAVSMLHAQVFKDTKKSSFKVSKNAVLEINANHTDVIIETWNKNTVAIEATIEVEGLPKEKAKSIIQAWEFEALGNKNKVQITSKSGDRMFIEYGNFDFKFENFDFPEIDIDLEALSKIEFRTIKIPDIDIEKLNLPEIPDLKILEDFNFSNYKKDSSYAKEWKERVRDVVDELQHSDWRIQVDSLRNSTEFKHQMERLKMEMKTLKINLQNEKERIFIDKKALKEALEIANKQSKKAMIVHKRHWTKSKRDSLKSTVEKSTRREIRIRGNSSNAAVKKRLKIKVPASMKFDLNIRHGKVKLPKGANHVSATISYGEFISEGLGEGAHHININHGPVQIESINSGSISLKNVPYAWFGTFSNASMFVNSGEVTIDRIGENCSLNQKFGKLSIHQLAKDFKQLNVVLDYAKGDFSFADTPLSFIISNKDSRIDKPSSFVNSQSDIKGGVTVDNGYQLDEKSTNKLILTGIYSTVKIN
ncbi:MAG: hypothetical protein COB60_02390 [Flavobacteriaceae bacterium]|nr:MAG: hypothetical protein COB60_02390 [Flavobacteriaceae bacterium]